jgi:hypothetical protein
MDRRNKLSSCIMQAIFLSEFILRKIGYQVVEQSMFEQGAE